MTGDTGRQLHSKTVGIMPVDLIDTGERDADALRFMVDQGSVDDLLVMRGLQLVHRVRPKICVAHDARAQLPALPAVEYPDRLLVEHGDLEPCLVRAVQREHERQTLRRAGPTFHVAYPCPLLVRLP